MKPSTNTKYLHNKIKDGVKQYQEDGTTKSRARPQHTSHSLNNQRPKFRFYSETLGFLDYLWEKSGDAKI